MSICPNAAISMCYSFFFVHLVVQVCPNVAISMCYKVYGQMDIYIYKGAYKTLSSQETEQLGQNSDNLDKTRTKLGQLFFSWI